MTDKPKYIQLPVQKTTEVYDEARQFIVKNLAINEDIHAIYEYGNLNIPGISDLDIIIVFIDKPEQKNLNSCLIFKEIPEHLLFLLGDNNIKTVSKQQFIELNILGEINTKLLWGNHLKLEERVPQTRHYYLICDVMDWLIERTLTMKYSVYHSNIPVMNYIGHLKSFCISIKNANLVLNKKILLGVEFCEKVSSLRDQWFETDISINLERLNKLCNDAVEIGTQYSHLFANYLTSNGYITPTLIENNINFILTKNKTLLFSKINNSHKINNNDDINLIETPNVWLTYLLYLSKLNGPVSDKIKKNIVRLGGHTDGNISKQIKKTINNRLRLCNSMAEYGMKHSLTSRLYRYSYLFE